MQTHTKHINLLLCAFMADRAAVIGSWLKAVIHQPGKKRVREREGAKSAPNQSSAAKIPKTTISTMTIAIIVAATAAPITTTTTKPATEAASVR